MNDSNGDNVGNKKRKTAVLVLALAAAISASVFFLASGVQPALAVSFSANNVTIDSGDGTITGVTVAPSGVVTWNGLDSVPENMKVNVYVSYGPSGKSDLTHLKGKTIQIATENQGKSGQQGFSLSAIDITDNIVLNWNKSDFECNTDGGSNTVSGIQIKVDAWVPKGGNTSAEVSDTFDVTVNNTAKSVSISGSANTGGSA